MKYRFALGMVAAMICGALTAACFAQERASPRQVSRDILYPGTITLHVDATDLDHKLLRIHETLPVRPGPLTLLYPEWIPGTHGPTNEVKRLAGLKFVAAGKPLAWKRDPADLHAFVLEIPAGVATLEADFQQLLPRQGNGYQAAVTPMVSDIQWPGTVLVPSGYYVSRIPVDASLRLPTGWQHASAMHASSGTPDHPGFERVSLETLIDSPVMAGPNFRRIDLDPGNARPVHFDVFADDPKSLEASEVQIEAHRNLVRQADRLFGARHYDHYDLMLALSDNLSNLGFEHHRSSNNGLKPGYFSDWAKGAVDRTLLPHEYVHSWNGKFRRPKDLWAPDLNVPTGNSLLWVYEGQTQYWGEVLAARSGLVDAEEARESFAQFAAAVKYRPGREWRPLADTAHDEIITGRGAGVEWRNWARFEDYYSEGALIWLDVDTRIRTMSGGQRSLDDFALAFFGMQDGRIEPLLYDFGDVVRALDRVQPYDWATFLRTQLDSVGRSPVDGLERSGWRLGWTDRKSDYAKNAESAGEYHDFVYSLGFTTNDKGAIGAVLWNSPAFIAGMAPGPTLLAVNRKAYKPDVLDRAIDAAKADGSPIELLLKDGDDFRNVRIDYRDGRRYPALERIDGQPDLLAKILSAR